MLGLLAHSCAKAQTHISASPQNYTFSANSFAISPFSGTSILGLVPSMPGDLSASCLSIGVGTFARQSNAFGAPTSQGQFGSRDFPEVRLSQG